MAARRLRYAYFDDLRKSVGAAGVCVAHHRNDSVETVLMNLIRGTGIRGLAGIRPVNGRILRPLLCLSRSDIEAYLHSVGQDFVTDSTNLVADVVRNKIRLEVLPLLAAINPNVIDTIRRTSDNVSEALKVFDAAVAASVGRVCTAADGRLIVDAERLMSEPSPECVLFEILKDKGFSPQQAGQICGCVSAPSGRVFASPSHELLVDRGRIIIDERRRQLPPLVIPEPGTYVMADGRRVSVARTPVDGGFAVPRGGLKAAADAASVGFPLTLRPVAPGDRFVPFGMKGSRLVSDYLTDLKVNLFDKRAQLILVSADGTPVWLVGRRTDNRCRITPQTAEALVVSVSRQESAV